MRVLLPVSLVSYSPDGIFPSGFSNSLSDIFFFVPLHSFLAHTESVRLTSGVLLKVKVQGDP